MTPPLSAMPWRLRVGLRALCASISLLVLVASGIAWGTYRNFTDNISHGSRIAGGGGGDGKEQNILLVGNDTRAGASREELDALHTGHDRTTVNADTMMVLHIPASDAGDKARPTLVSFPRDSWVDIPGEGFNKLNAAYPGGYNEARSKGKSEKAAESAGLEATIATIQKLTGLKINHYMQVNLLGFYRISKAIGGVEVCLKNAQNKTTETDGYKSGFSGIDLPKGVSTIEGKQALAFVRQRHGLPHGDLDRVKRQQYFLKATFAKMTSAGTLLNPLTLQKLVDAVSSSLLTDPDLDLLALAQQFSSLATGKIDFETIPNNGSQTIYPGGVETSVVEIDRKAIPAFVAQLNGKGDDALQDADAAAPGSVTADVLNGTDTAKLASRNAEGLRELGFKVDKVDSTDETKKTVVQYAPGQEKQAKALLAAVPKATSLLVAGLDRPTVVIGTNNAMVKGVAAPSGATPATSSGTSSGTSKTSAPDAADGIGCID